MQRSPLLPHLEEAGARLAERPEAPGHTAILTFGDVPAEVRAGADAAALFDASDRGSLRVTGADAGTFLHRILANDVRGIVAGGGNRNLLLTGKGKVCFDFDLAFDGESFLISTPPGRAGPLGEAIDMYLFNDDVEMTDLTEETAPLELVGAAAVAIVAEVLGSAPPTTPHSFVDVAWHGAAVRVTAVPVTGVPGLRVDAGPGSVLELWQALTAAGAQPAGIVARDFLRVEAGAALHGVDIDDGIYPQEANLDDAFSLDKGCYIGQEVVAKIDTYGGLNKRLLVLRVSHDDPVPPGTRLLREEKGEDRDLGVVTSWGYSFALDGGLVLGYVKRRHQENGTAFKLGETGATATIVAPPRT